jgi:hypothetical protein
MSCISARASYPRHRSIQNNGRDLAVPIPEDPDAVSAVLGNDHSISAPFQPRFRTIPNRLFIVDQQHDALAGHSG